MILYTDVKAEPALDPRHLPRYRPIQKADSNDLLDELGDYLKHIEHLEPDPLPEEQRTTILRKVEAYYATARSRRHSFDNRAYQLHPPSN